MLPELLLSPRLHLPSVITARTNGSISWTGSGPSSLLPDQDLQLKFLQVWTSQAQRNSATSKRKMNHSMTQNCLGEISLEIRSDDDELLLESKIQKYRQCCRTEYASENKGTRIEWLAEGEDSDRERHFVLDFPVGSPGWTSFGS